MNARTVIVALLALISGIAAAVAVNRYLTQPQQTATPIVVKPETTPVVVAAIDIGRATTLRPEMLALREWPKDLVPPGAFTDLSAVVDRTLSTGLVVGEPVLQGKVADGRGLESLVTSGMRALTILTPTPATGVAGFILPGNRVDVLLIVSDNEDKSTGGATISTLLQNIEVLAVAEYLDAPAENKVQKLSSVTLSCTPENCEKLSLGGSKGTLHLTLRNRKDTADAETRVLAMSELQYTEEPPQAEMVAPASLPAPTFEKHIIPAVRVRTMRATGSGSVIIRPAREELRPVTAEDLEVLRPAHSETSTIETSNEMYRRRGP